MEASTEWMFATITLLFTKGDQFNKQHCQLLPNFSDILCEEALYKTVAHWLKDFLCLSNIVDITSQSFSWNTLHKH